MYSSHIDKEWINYNEFDYASKNFKIIVAHLEEMLKFLMKLMNQIIIIVN